MESTMVERRANSSELSVPFSMNIRSRRGLYSKIIKPILDIIFSICLIVMASPIFICIPLLIKLDSKGPILFKQLRYGEKGRIFNIYKFRTMYVDTPNEGRSPTSGADPRITKIGRLLRRTSIDELPQLMNILKGEMSFIGPRPEQKSIVETEYSEWERQRFLAVPGITGLWQISSERIHPIHNNLQYDLKYISEVSLKLDLKIIWGTFRILLNSNTH
ncbi:hypothetical protein ASG89_30090 [Paenibacillus sp. Soil766]|uniref:sugar transferase n=1 Tax=Paenibacillus sp. Soil766 TaxID=1736404 RepID=UPI00070A7693|nr:sugar transferase [Paenibacillus sp. Soil766]KRE97107.1 hypothetical protein ASG89_30090 [Paenibacillus sp. Soil766]